MRCPRCGNENPAINRFCGMCGATLLESAAVAAGSQASSTTATVAATPGVPAQADRAQSAPAETRAAEPPYSSSEPESGISGPSFLGLNNPPPRRRASLSVDPRGASSRDLDYLLEDSEEPKRGGGGKILLILVALALAAGFGYLRWKNQGFGWMGAGSNKPSPTAQAPSGTDSASQPAANNSAGNPTPSPGQPSGRSLTEDTSSPNAATPSGAAPANTPAPNPPASGAQASGTPATSAPASAPPANGTAATSAPVQTTSPSSAAGTGAASAPAGVTKTPATPPPDATDSDSDAATPSSPAASAAPQPAAEAPAKPAPAAKPVDPVGEAQKYIYGRGVRQDCDHGLRILKPAAAQANSKAMIEMGALYSAGLCTPRDLPTAYRWFALALRKDPDNQAVQTDLQKLWGEMTQPERQLAIRMSQ